MSLLPRIKLWLGFFTKISYQRDLPLVISAFRHRHTHPIPSHIWQMIDKNGGFLSRKEAGLLYWAACNWPVAGSVIELGSYEGRSTGIFALAGREVYAVDAWSLDVADLSAFGQGTVQADIVFDRFKANLRDMQIENKVSIHRGLTSTVAKTWHQEAAILFIDAGHTYQDVKSDLRLWTPHLHPQGILLMHDVLGDTFLGVTQAASELLSSGWQVVASAGSIVAFQRK